MAAPETLTLPDGRELAHAEYGPADGRPVFCFHGIPGSRRLWTLLEDAAADRNARLIAPDRPGFGASDHLPDRDLLDWPGDVAALADALDVSEFGVVGFSGGGPHAAACAVALPDRVGRTVLVSSAAPPALTPTGGYYELGVEAAKRSIPGFYRGFFEAAGWLARNWRSRCRAAVERGVSEPDLALFDGPAGEVVVDDWIEAFRGGGRGPAREFPLVTSPWGFDPSAVTAPVSVFHGADDRTIDATTARAFADALPSADLTLAETGHYSTLVERARPVLGAATD